MKRLGVFLSSFLLFVSLSCFASAQNGQTRKSVLFVIHAPSAQILKHNGSFSLAIHPAPLDIHYFTDRPNRDVGKISLQQFLKVWNYGKDSFKKDHPNAAIVGVLDETDGKKHSDSFIELSEPAYHALTNTMTFQIQTISPVSTLCPRSIQDIVLFIDDFGCTCSGDCPIPPGSPC